MLAMTEAPHKLLQKACLQLLLLHRQVICRWLTAETPNHPHIQVDERVNSTLEHRKKQTTYRLVNIPSRIGDGIANIENSTESM